MTPGSHDGPAPRDVARARQECCRDSSARVAPLRGLARRSFAAVGPTRSHLWVQRRTPQQARARLFARTTPATEPSGQQFADQGRSRLAPPPTPARHSKARCALRPGSFAVARARRAAHAARAAAGDGRRGRARATHRASHGRAAAPPRSIAVRAGAGLAARPVADANGGSRRRCARLRRTRKGASCSVRRRPASSPCVRAPAITATWIAAHRGGRERGRSDSRAREHAGSLRLPHASPPTLSVRAHRATTTTRRSSSAAVALDGHFRIDDLRPGPTRRVALSPHGGELLVIDGVVAKAGETVRDPPGRHLTDGWSTCSTSTW